MVPICVVRELYCLKKKKKKKKKKKSVLVVRIALLEYSKIHEKAYKCIVCEFGGFQNVLRDACVCAIPT